MGGNRLVNQSYLYCMDTELGWGNRSYFTFFSQFNRGSTAALLSALESAILVLFFLLSTVSNGLIFYTLSSNRRLRTVTNYFVCNLTLADVCFTLCCPFVAVNRVTGTWTMGSFACKTIVYLSFVCGFVTIWTLSLISVDRYICIVRNSKRRITPTAALVLIAIIWIFTLAAFSPLLLYFVVKDCPFGTGVVSICTLGWPRTSSVNVAVIFTSIVSVFGFVVPSVLLVVCYLFIFVKVRKVRLAMNSQQQRRFSTSTTLLANNWVWNSPSTSHRCYQKNNTSHGNLHAAAFTSSPGAKVLNGHQSEPLLFVGSRARAKTFSVSANTSTLEAKKRRNIRDIQVVKTLVYLVLLFFAMWTPIFVVFLLIMRDAYFNVMEVSSQAFLGATCMAYLNAMLNPLAYGLSTERLRKYLHLLLTCSGRFKKSSSALRAGNAVGAVSIVGASAQVSRHVDSPQTAKSSGETSTS